VRKTISEVATRAERPDPASRPSAAAGAVRAV